MPARSSAVTRDRRGELLRGAPRPDAAAAAYGKTVVFGIFERQGQVYTEIVPDYSKPTPQSIIRGRVGPRAVINSNDWPGYNGLVDLGYGHFRVDHSRDEFTKGAVHVNGIEGFRDLAKVRLPNPRACPDTPSISTSEKPKGGTTVDTPTSAKPCYNTLR